MPYTDIFSGQPSRSAPRKRGGLLYLQQRRDGVPEGPPSVRQPPLPRTEPVPPPDAPNQRAMMQFDRMRAAGRVRYAPNAVPYLRESELADAANWFFSPDGRNITFDPLYRRGYRGPPGQLNKDPYRLGDVPGYDELRAPWRQDNDQAIIRAATIYNDEHRYRTGHPRYLPPAYFKAMVMNEAGGEGDEQQFHADPAQMLVPDDWDDGKYRITGLSDPGDPENRARVTRDMDIMAGVDWWGGKQVRRDNSGAVVEVYGLEDTARRYNGRTDRPARLHGKTFGEDYASRTMRGYEGMRKR